MSKYFSENGVHRDGGLNGDYLAKFNGIFKNKSSGHDEKLVKFKNELGKANVNLQEKKDAVTAAKKAEDQAFKEWLTADSKCTAINTQKRFLREKLLNEYTAYLLEKEHIEQEGNEAREKAEFMAAAEAKFAE